MRHLITLCLLASVTLAADPPKKAKAPDPNAPPEALAEQYTETPPPGWLPVNTLDDKTPWKTIEDQKDKVRLYLPNGDKPVRGVYVSVVFHSQDPRELARLWDFALVTIPWQLLYDVGLGDTRNPRAKETGYPKGNMAFLLHYLEKAAEETKHPELKTAPIVGWMMQGGYEHAPDLYKRAPDRVLAWSDSFAHITKYTDCLKHVPFVIAWEENATKEKQRVADRPAKLNALADTLTPLPSLLCEATTYDMPHGVYSKWYLFAVYLDRCIRTRMPDKLPEPGKPVKLKPFDRESGWAADFDEVSEWVPIAPVKSAKSMVSPQWLPDEYAAWAYRAFHSHDPLLTLTSPATEYQMSRQFPGGDRGPCGMGFGKVEGKAGEAVTLQAGPRTAVGKEKRTVDWPYVKVEFRDGDRLLGTADAAPWKLGGVKLDAGLHALIAVGVLKDGSRACSRPALYGVR